MSASVPSALGAGVLRPDPAFAQCFVGTATIAGFPYLLTAVREVDANGSRLRLSFAAAPRETPS